MSAETEAAKQDSARDKVSKEEEKQDSTAESCSRDSTCSESVSTASQKPDNSNPCVENVANGHLKNSESGPVDKPDILEMSTSVSDCHVDSVPGDNSMLDIADDIHTAAGCSAESAVESGAELSKGDALQSPADEKHSNTDTEIQSPTPVCEFSEHRVDTCSESKLEQTDMTATHSDCTVSDVGRDCLQSKEQDQPVHHDSNDKIDTESVGNLHPDLSPALMNEVS